MKYKGKEIRVILSKEAQTQYDELKAAVEKEIKDGITKSFNQQLLKSIDNKIAYLKMNPVAGESAQKPLPEMLVQKYGISNLWIMDLINYWRLLYTLKSNEVEIISFVLEWMNHGDYNKLFGRKRR